MKLSTVFLLFAALLLIPAAIVAQTQVTIGRSVSSGGSWSGGDPDVFTATSVCAKVNYLEIEARLNAGTSVTITTTDGWIVDSHAVT